MKSEFLTITSHQLRAPVTKVKWAMSMLFEEDYGKINEEQREREVIKQGFEIFNALKQFRFKNKKNSNSNNYPLNYCIGHGLFFTKDIFLKLNGFDEKMHNEDAIFGFELSYYQELIMPVPYFDESDTPDTIKSLCLQKSNWFFGPLQSFQYYKKILNRKEPEEKINRFKLFILSAKLFSHALGWILGPTFFILSFVLAFSKACPLFIGLAFLESILYLAVPDFLSWLVVRKENDEYRNYKYIFYSLFGSIPYYALHGLSAYRTLIQVVIYSILKRPIEKHKTRILNKI